MSLKIAGRKVAGTAREKAEERLSHWATTGPEVASYDAEETQDMIAVEVVGDCRLTIIERLCGRLNALYAAEVKAEVRTALGAAPVEKSEKKPKRKGGPKKVEKDEIDAIDDLLKGKEVA
jgi:hypothetical protein